MQTNHRSNAALLSLFLSFGALAHEGGHGPKLVGPGPGGGQLSAVILASESEAGERAKLRSVTEWWVRGDELRLKHWSADRQRIQRFAEGSEVKLIFLGPKLAKPVVLKFETANEAEFSRRIADDLLTRAEKLEVIYPATSETTEKQVSVLQF